MTWSSEILKWNPGDFNGLDTITLTRAEIWYPDIEVFNRVNFVNPYYDYTKRIRLFSNGSMSLCDFKTMSVSCDTDMYAFPVDRHQCSILFGSSTYGLEKLNLIPFLKMTYNDFEEARKRFSEWRLRAADFRLVKGKAEDYFDFTLQLDIVIGRRFSYHFFRFVIPMCLATSLTVLFCWLPMDTARKFLLPLIALLIMMYTTSQYFPMLSHSSTLPLFLKFATDLMFFTAFMIFLAILAVALDGNETFVLPTHPLLNRILHTEAVSSYILADEALLLETDDGAEDGDSKEQPATVEADDQQPAEPSTAVAAEAPHPAEQLPNVEAAAARNWPRLLTVLQRVFSVLFLTSYLAVYYLTIGRIIYNI